jgi:transketolase
MAIAERTLAARFNRPGHDIVGHHTYVALGDGCLMEGISHEAASLAGTLGLEKLVAIYDSNGISIDGRVEGWFTEDVAARFKAYGWRVIAGVDGHDAAQVRKALRKARRPAGKPTLVICRTVIGWGAPTKQGGHDCHGAALGADEVARARTHMGWPHGPFQIPDEYYKGWDARRRGARVEGKWRRVFKAYAAAHPELAAEFQRCMSDRLPEEWDERSRAFVDATAAGPETVATRKASQNALNAYGQLLPELLGGSADLTGSNLTWWSGSTQLTAGSGGNYIYYGVREFAMAAISNGIALHGGLLPYCGTFLVFSDYARNALRMAALMGVRNIFVLTHDSIGLGEDGPTHQPVEHAATLRLIPNMSVWRPCDAVETAVAWKAAIERASGPTCLLLSRQNVKPMARTAEQMAAIRRGGYVLVDAGPDPDAIIIATGTEAGLAVEAAAELHRSGQRVRVVSMPCTDLFDAQPAAYRDQVLPPSCRRRVAVEAGIPDYWYKYVGLDGAVLGVPHFGASAPGPDVYRHFGLTAAGVAQKVRSLF